jgi:hypothetical protein
MVVRTTAILRGTTVRKLLDGTNKDKATDICPHVYYPYNSAT